MVLVCVALLGWLGMAGWRAFLSHAGGAFVHAPEDARWLLPDAAQALIHEAFSGLEHDRVVDYRVLAVSAGQLGSDKIVNDSFYRQGQAGPLAWVIGQLRLSAAGVDGVGDLDASYLSRLLRQVRALPADYRMHLLARGWRYDDAGERDVEGTYTHVANAYVWWLAQQVPDVIEPVVSIHPYRADARAALAKWAERGVSTVAWQPLRQNIDLTDARTEKFYQALAAHHMTLQLPVGSLTTSYARERRQVQPQALQAALQAGVSVVVAIRGNGDNDVVEAVMRLLRGPHAEQVQVLLAGALSRSTLDSILLPLLQHPRLYSHFLFASDYPRSAVNMTIDLRALARAGFIRAADVEPLRAIYQLNPLLFVFVTMRHLRLPQTQVRLATSVFTAGVKQ